jgi:hypothetical protein
VELAVQRRAIGTIGHRRRGRAARHCRCPGYLVVAGAAADGGYWRCANWFQFLLAASVISNLSANMIQEYCFSWQQTA